MHNDAVFDDGDFDNITHLGNSDKSGKVNKIGRFGVGVNVMYHISDVPAFVSRDRFVFFDPHAIYLPGINPAMPGKSIFHLGDDKEVVAEYGDMFAPFNAFGFLPDAAFDGTLFRFEPFSAAVFAFVTHPPHRLPLRTQVPLHMPPSLRISLTHIQLLAQSSRLSDQVYSPDDMHALLRSFAREMGSCLLFLKSVCSISLSVWQPHAASPSSIYSSSLASVPRNSFTRARLDAAAAAGKGDDLFAPTTHVEVLDVTTECEVTHARIRETFVVCSQVLQK